MKEFNGYKSAALEMGARALKIRTWMNVSLDDFGYDLAREIWAELRQCVTWQQAADLMVRIVEPAMQPGVMVAEYYEGAGEFFRMDWGHLLKASTANINLDSYWRMEIARAIYMVLFENEPTRLFNYDNPAGC